MPFLVDTVSREITEIFVKPRGNRWTSVIFDIKELTAWHYELEYEYKSIWSLHNGSNLVITQTRDEAWDFEYATRENSRLEFMWGPPSPIVFPTFNLQRQDALSSLQWRNLLSTIG